jgi:CBS domain-containing protein
MNVLTILKQHSRPVCTVTSNQSIADAIKLMTARKADALIVTDDDHPAGIFSGEDVFRYYRQTEKLPPTETKLIDIITGMLITVAPTDKIITAIDLLIKSDSRHLPVMENDKIIRVLTLKDVLGCQIDLLTDEIHALQDYIDDLHEAAQD